MSRRPLPRRARARATALGLLIGSACDEGTVDEVDDLSEVPRIEACNPARGWSAAWTSIEADALDRLDAIRSRGFDCGDAGKRPSAPALRRHGALTCAARVHALAMATRGFVGHLDPEGLGPDDRVAAAEYDGIIVEHWAAGPDDAHALLDELWLPASSHCADLVARDWTDVGLGYVGDTDDEHGNFWVLVLGSP